MTGVERRRHGSTRRERLRPGIWLLAVLGAVSLGACSGAAGQRAVGPAGHSPGAAPDRPANAAAVTRAVPAGSSGSPAAVKALEASADPVRAQVSAVVRPIRPILASSEVTVDDAGPCEVGEPGPWPRRWGYGVRLALRTTDSPAAARTLRDRLAGQGWRLHAYPGTSDSLDFDARKGGLVLRISGEPNPATVTAEGYGPCVSGDGKIRGA